MTAKEYKSRLSSILDRVKNTVGDNPERCLQLDAIYENLVSVLCENGAEEEIMHNIDNTKQSLILLLKRELEATQIEFVEMGESDDSDKELFKTYLLDLKEYKQNLISPSSDLRVKVSASLRRSKINLLNELQSQAIIFPTECLDTILACEEVQQENGANWVIEQINEALNTLLEEVNARLSTSFNAVNELLGSEIKSLENTYTQAINLGMTRSSSMSDDMFGLARQALPSIGIGSIGYGATACLLGPIAGIVAGLTAGGLFIWKAQSTSSKQKKIAELKQQLAPKITLAMTELKTYVTEKYEDFEEELNRSIDMMAETLSKEMQDCVDALKSCEQDTKHFETLEIRLNNKMTALESYIKQLEILNTNPFKLN